MTYHARRVLDNAEVIAGYHIYLELLGDLIAGKEIIASGMTREVERCTLAVERARAGRRVAVVSSGDPGVYGMAGLVLQLTGDDLPVEVVPGVTAATAAAAALGAPLGHDFTVISLSDLLTPWAVIERRLVAAGEGDFITVLYNPASARRSNHLILARDILLRYRPPDTPAGIVRNAARGAPEVTLTTLDRLHERRVDMLTTVIIGSTATFASSGRMITPRGYDLEGRGGP